MWSTKSNTKKENCSKSAQLHFKLKFNLYSYFSIDAYGKTVENRIKKCFHDLYIKLFKPKKRKKSSKCYKVTQLF